MIQKLAAIQGGIAAIFGIRVSDVKESNVFNRTKYLASGIKTYMFPLTQFMRLYFIFNVLAEKAFEVGRAVGLASFDSNIYLRVASLHFLYKSDNSSAPQR